MKKLFSRKTHGIAEYSYIPLATAAPELFGFEKEKNAQLLSRVTGAIVTASALTTKAEWGLLKAIPFRVHLAADITLGAFSICAPWIFGFNKSRNARNAFLLLGLISIAVPLLTKKEDMDDK